MYTAEVMGIGHLLAEGCNAIKTYGKEVKARGTVSKEVRPCLFQVNDPTDRTLIYPGRGNNPFQSIYETLWVLGSCDNNISNLRHFLPRADDYSDNPNSKYSRWRAGYPERIRNYNCSHELVFDEMNAGMGSTGASRKDGIDQFKYVYETLKADNDSRQAVIGIWDARYDEFYDVTQDELLKTKDRPCTQSVMFCIREGELDCAVTMRSNDAIYGLSSINMYEFTVMQEILAKLLGVKIGKYYHFTNSLHIYDCHYEKMNTIIENYNKDYKLIDVFSRNKSIPRFKWSDFVKSKDYNAEMHSFEFIYKIMSKPQYFKNLMERALTGEHTLQAIVSEFNCVLQNYFFIYLCCIDGRFNLTDVLEMFRYIQDSDLKFACIYWVIKHYKVKDANSLSIIEDYYKNLTCII